MKPKENFSSSPKRDSIVCTLKRVAGEPIIPEQYIPSSSFEYFTSTNLQMLSK